MSEDIPEKDEDENYPEMSMSDVESGYDYWGINKEDVPLEIKEATLAMLQETMSKEGMDEGQSIYSHAINIVGKAHEDSVEFARAMKTVPGLVTAMASTCAQFVELLENQLGIEIRYREGEHEGMPANKDVAGIIASGVELCMALGYIAKQSIEYEHTLDTLWGDTGVATKEEMEAEEKSRTSNEGLESLGELPELHQSSGGECMDCGVNFETDSELTKHALAKHSGE